MNNKQFSNKQEKQVAKKIGGKKQPNSGATPFAKGDVKTPLFLIECKTMVADRESISIKREWIQKLKEEAFSMNRPYYSLAFNFGGLENKNNFYIIDERLFEQLHRYLQEDQDA